MSRRDTPRPRKRTVAGSVYRDVWESSLDACFMLHGERDAAGEIADFVFDEVNPRGVAVLGLPKDAIVGRKLREIVAISRGSALFKGYVHVAETRETLDDEPSEAAKAAA